MNDQQLKPLPAASKTNQGPAIVRSAFLIVGLLLMGAGVCCAVFCYHFFTDAAQLKNTAAQAQKSADAANDEARKLGNNPDPKATALSAGVPLDKAAWKELAREEEARAARQQIQSLSSQVHAYKNLTVTIGLFLGGVSLCLLGWGLRPKGTLHAMTLHAEPGAPADARIQSK
jgi:hypothetical protein